MIINYVEMQNEKDKKYKCCFVTLGNMCITRGFTASYVGVHCKMAIQKRGNRQVHAVIQDTTYSLSNRRPLPPSNHRNGYTVLQSGVRVSFDSMFNSRVRPHDRTKTTQTKRSHSRSRLPCRRTERLRSSPLQ